MKLDFSCAAVIKPEEYPQGEQMEGDCVSGVVSVSSSPALSEGIHKISSSAVV